MSNDIIGPANAPNALIARPTDDRSFGANDTWFGDCTSSTANDGTRVKAAWLNAVTGAFRAIMRGNGNTAGAVPVVADSNADDMVLKAIQHMIQRGQPLYADDTSAVANAVVVALSPAPAELKKGMVIISKLATSNTGATTLKVNGFAPVAVLHPDLTALVKYDLNAAAMGCFVFDGTQFQLAWTQRQPGALGPVTRVLLVTTTQTVTTAANEVAAHIRMYGPGGGGGGAGPSGAGSGGGGGEYAEGVVSVTPSTPYTATIGAKGLAGAAGGGNGTDGGTTNFGGLMTAVGGKLGYGGSGAIMTTPGAGGTSGTGGQIRFGGSSGAVAVNLSGTGLYLLAIGGYSYGLAALPFQYVPLSAVVGSPGAIPGNGGGGGFHTAAGGVAYDGMMIITFYAK